MVMNILSKLSCIYYIIIIFIPCLDVWNICYTDKQKKTKLRHIFIYIIYLIIILFDAYERERQNCTDNLAFEDVTWLWHDVSVNILYILYFSHV